MNGVKVWGKWWLNWFDKYVFFLVDISNIVLEMNILLNIIFCDEMCIWS